MKGQLDDAWIALGCIGNLGAEPWILTVLGTLDLPAITNGVATAVRVGNMEFDIGDNLGNLLFCGRVVQLFFVRCSKGFDVSLELFELEEVQKRECRGKAFANLRKKEGLPDYCVMGNPYNFAAFS